MKTVSFFRPGTGELTGRTFSGPAAAVARNTPAGLAAIEGKHDPLTKRVNLETLQVEDKPSES